MKQTAAVVFFFVTGQRIPHAERSVPLSMSLPGLRVVDLEIDHLITYPHVNFTFKVPPPLPSPRPP